MSFDKLAAAGGESVGGIVYVGRKEAGRFIKGNFITTPHGDAVIAAHKPLQTPSAKSNRAAVATKVKDEPTAPAPAAPAAPVTPVQVSVVAPPPPLPKALQQEAALADAELMAQLNALTNPPQA
jgi:hypothetical protein